MNKKFVGVLIKRERLAKDWSQEGLCKGICAVSYLSKIEQGKTEASPEIVHLLLDRLDVCWYDDDLNCKQAGELVERLYDAIFSVDRTASETASKDMDKHWEIYSKGPYMLDFMILKAWITDEEDSVLQEYEEYFDERQQTLWLLLHQKEDEALRRNPSAFTYYYAGSTAYHYGNYPLALERLQQSYRLAAEQGYAYIMLDSRLLIGNCYSNNMEFDRMQEHYKIATRLANALKDEASLEDMKYNIASTSLELGNVEESYAYFSKLKSPKPMALHKLAICYEKLGKTTEALMTLDKIEIRNKGSLTKDLVLSMCNLVRYRLEHPNYLKDPAYGEMLLSCFDSIKSKLPSGYAGFHLPWVVEWYTATRQYKQVYELLVDFPVCKILKPVKQD